MGARRWGRLNPGLPTEFACDCRARLALAAVGSWLSTGTEALHNDVPADLPAPLHRQSGW